MQFAGHIQYTNMASNTHKHACACLIINAVFLETDNDFEINFGIKRRFRRLKFVDIQDIEKIVKVVLSRFVLHEFFWQHDDDCAMFVEK